LRIADRHGDLELVLVIIAEVEAGAVGNVREIDHVADGIDRPHRQRFGDRSEGVLVDRTGIVALTCIAAQFTGTDCREVEPRSGIVVDLKCG
jgi:hypothetical protein